MKNLGILLVVICSISSCAKEETYSCNPEANLWIKSNLTEIKDMTRAEWLAIDDYHKQRAAYAVFTPYQRQAIWIGKMDEVLTLDWTEEERLHIQSMRELIKGNIEFYFNELRTQEVTDKLELLFYRWEEYAREELGWDNKLLYALVYSPQVMNANKEIKSEFATSVSTPTRLKNRKEEDNEGVDVCNCNIDYTSYDCELKPPDSGIVVFCSMESPQNRCIDKDNFYCGPTGAMRCNGLCWERPIKID